MNKGEVKAITADVVLGTHVQGDKKTDGVPVIFQEKVESNFSLDEFITEAIAHHKKSSKIIQLNFVEIDAVKKSIDVLLYRHREV